MEYSLEELFKEHQAFAKSKFPESTWDSSLKGLMREIMEVQEAKLDYYVIDGSENTNKLGLEYADCFAYLIDSMARAGFEIGELNHFFKQKLDINKERDWKKNKDGSYSHVK